MNGHLRIVANAFKVGGVVLGLPSLPGFLAASWVYLQLRFLPVVSDAGGTSRDGLIQSLEWAAGFFNWAFSLIGGTLQWVAGCLAIVCFLALCLAVSLVLIGRGLYRHRRWARIFASLLAACLLLAALLGLLALPRGVPRIADSLLTIACLYSLWTLWRKYE